MVAGYTKHIKRLLLLCRRIFSWVQTSPPPQQSPLHYICIHNSKLFNHSIINFLFQILLLTHLHLFIFFFHFCRTNTGKSLQNKKRVIQMLFVVVLEFFICWTPLYIINTIALFNPQAIYQTLGYTTISYFQLLAYSSSCCNPITYCFMNRGFRKACLNLFRCCKKFHESRRISIGGGPIGVTQSSEVT